MPIRRILPKTAVSLQPTIRVENLDDPYIRKAIRDLLDTLADHQQVLDRQFPGKGMGVGLAANQIEYPEDEYPKNFIPPNLYVVSIRPERARQEGCTAIAPSVYINADFSPIDDAKQEHYEEGCLSISGIKGFFVPRYYRIELTALNEQGELTHITAEGFVARVHQHEIDHGHGEEYLNRMNFSKWELQQILTWIDQHPIAKKVTPPLWVIPGKLQCVTENPDLNSLAIWVQATLKKAQITQDAYNLFSNPTAKSGAPVTNFKQMRAKL